MDTPTVSAWLGGHLAARQWSQGELAARIGVSAAAVSCWVRGKHGIRPGVRRRLADALGIPVTDIPIRSAGSGPSDLGRVNPDPASFGAWLAGELRERGWSASEMARRMDIAPERVSQYRRGDRRPDAEAVYRMAKAMGVSADVILARMFGGTAAQCEAEV